MSALISECGIYRYWLRRDTEHKDVTLKSNVLFIMLNPSTADGEKDDATIRRLKGFATSWGFLSLAVANLYAYRATNPKDLWKCEDPVGRDNNDHLATLSFCHGHVVCAWGANAKLDRVRQVRSILVGAGATLWHLGMTKDGHPRHPLYVKGDQPLIRLNAGMLG